MNNISSTKKRVSYILKLVIICAAIIGTFLTAYAERNSVVGAKRAFMYFTIQSNIAIALISAVGCCLLIMNKTESAVWHVIKFVGTVSITLTGVVFCFVLAPTFKSNAWNVQNVLTHVVVPVFAVIDFFVIASCVKINRKNVFYVIIPPLLYAIYAGIGYKLNWQFADGYNYPYFFLNWGSAAGAFGFSKELPFMGTVWWIISLFVFLILVGCCYLAVADCIREKCCKK